MPPQTGIAGVVAALSITGDLTRGHPQGEAMRACLLATELGMIYHTKLTVNAAQFAKGGWLYADLADGSDYAAQQREHIRQFIETGGYRRPTVVSCWTVLLVMAVVGAFLIWFLR